MKTSDFDFYLPKELIAQTPLLERDSSKLLVVKRETAEISETKFSKITDYLNSDDVLVINETKVLPGRLKGLKKDTLAKIEILLLKELQDGVWEVLVKPAKRVTVGTIIDFSDSFFATCTAVLDDGIRVVTFTYQGIFLENLEQVGILPLPPYIKKELSDLNRYQTVYASTLGSAAAPTAGLHFTSSLLADIAKIGVKVIKIVLHVGIGTFRPITVSDPLKHHMHSEDYFISKESAAELNKAIKLQKRIIAVGTTSVRALESNYDGFFHEGRFKTDIFIYPGYQFKVVNSMITNFHLPKSTLMMLVSAFSNTHLIKKAYSYAIEKNFRFFSFGDAMFLI